METINKKYQESEGKDNIPKENRLRHLQRWVNNRIIFRTCEKFEEYKKKVI